MAREPGSPSFGLWYDFRQELPAMQNYADFYAECLEEIVEGESLGFSDVWLSEHHFVDDGYLPSPLVVAGAIAARTRDIRIGTNVLLLPLHHPLRVAEDSVVVDLISGGRFTLGVGLGYVQNEYDALGVDMGKRPSLIEEGVEVIRQCFTEGRTGYEGSRWNFKDLPFAPRARGKATGIPRRLHGPGVRPGRPHLRRLSGLGTFEQPRGYLPQRPGEARRAWAGGGRFPVCGLGHGLCARVAGSGLGPCGPGDSLPDEPLRRVGLEARRRHPPAGYAPTTCRPGEYAVGTPEEVTESLVRLYREAPYDHLCFWGRLPGMTHEQALSSMRLFATEVAPRFREAVEVS